MASTDADGDGAPGRDGGDGGASIVTLDAAGDMAPLLALSASAHWNQNEADWRMMLALGQGWGLRTRDGTLAASVVALPYAGDFAWLSMVLVLPAYQRRGCATRILRHGLAVLADRGLGAVLDATPAGHAVYVQEGFAPTWGFARYRSEGAGVRESPARTATTEAAGATTRPLRDADWDAVDALDRPAFGASRRPLLRALARRAPAAARVAERDGRVCGFVLGRDGREAFQIGPLLAPDAAVATRLVDDVIGRFPGPFHVDLRDAQRAPLLPALAARGFALQRPFTRMVHGRADAPGDPRDIVLVAGPELG